MATASEGPLVAISQALDAAGKVIKKQQSCEAAVNKCLGQLIELLSKGREELMSEDCLDPDIAVKELQKAVEDSGLLKDMQAQTKDLHSAIGKLSKVGQATLAAARPARGRALAPWLLHIIAAATTGLLLSRVCCPGVCWCEKFGVHNL